jgi:hypothetical protein
MISVGSAFVALALTVGWRPYSSAQETLPPPSPITTIPASTIPANDGYLGVGSCASPACHGGPDSAENIRQRGKWNSAYTVWVERDRHAKAYAVLYSPQSKEILRNLDHLDPATDPMPQRDRRCLACHSTAAKTPAAAETIAVDGVGCEACHGAARRWLTEHTARDWNKLDPVTHRDTHGPAADADGRMVNTRDMAVRAGVCVDCHVGSPRADGLPERNMNHDMIAAGHPRLTFEMSAFLANMPHHWDDRDEKRRDDYAAHVWAVGQFASTQAALRLLAARAKAAEAAPETPAAPKNNPWPELSEYDCYTCHHGLSLDNYRQKAVLRNGGTRKSGHYVWGSWYMPMTRLLAAQSAGSSGVPGIDHVLSVLDDPSPGPIAVRKAAEVAAKEMQPLLDAAKKTRYDRQFVDRLLLATKDHPATNWDEACGQYLLLRNACSQDPRFTASLAALRGLLQFRDTRQEDGTRIQYNSPVGFIPAAFNDKMHEVRTLLPRQ